MPENIRRTLLDSLEIIFPNALRNTDTKEEGHSNTFLAVHMSWYNRFSEHVSLCSTYLNDNYTNLGVRVMEHHLIKIHPLSLRKVEAHLSIPHRKSLAHVKNSSSLVRSIKNFKMHFHLFSIGYGHW